MSGFKRTTIQRLLNNKMEALIESITDSKVKEAVAKDSIVSGGAIASMLLGEQINDYDIYFRTYDTTLLVTNYYVDLFNALNGKLKTAVKDCNPEVKESSIVNIKGETEQRITIYIKSAGVASESQEEYNYFESLTEDDTEKFTESLHQKPIETAELIVEEIKDKTNKYKPVFLSDNAITLTNKVQLVIRFYGDPKDILRNYDFAHAMNYYDYGHKDLVLHQDALECLLSKTLIYKGSLYPIASIFRTRKFIQRGWRISAGQMLKMIWQLNDVNLKDSAILREQLLGVDQAYMVQLIRALENEKGKIDATYIAKLIDEIFET
jgi:hypothetical protein